MKIIKLPLLAFALVLLFVGSSRAEDVLTLDDGTVMKGKFIKEEGGNVFLQQAGGETSVIAKSRVKRMEITTGPLAADALKAAEKQKDVASGPKNAAPLIGNRNNSPKTLDPAWANPRIAEMEDLGSPELAKRKAALEKALANKDEYLIVMLAMLNPKLKTAEYVRIGILRALLEFAPLSDEAARTVSYAAMFDPYPEARREACRTIRYLQDDRAVRDLVKYGAVENNSSLKNGAAVALHEVDDNRIYGALVSQIPAPEVNANYGNVSGLDKPRFVIPGGPGRLNMPVYTPSQSVAGVASDYGGPIVELLKALARKDMGNFSYGWLIWYREKVGEIGKDDRDAYKSKSMREHMNAP